jgi:Arc/MetJ family transcription regulator
VYNDVYGEEPLMRTNIVLDDELVEEAARVTGITTKKDLVHEALRVLIATRKRKSLLDLEGKIQFAPGYDYKALREGRR